jgi:hypothetical protein
MGAIRDFGRGLYNDAKSVLRANESAQRQVKLFAEQAGKHVTDIENATEHITEKAMRDVRLNPVDVRKRAEETIKNSKMAATPDLMAAHEKDAALSMLKERQSKLNSLADNDSAKFTDMSGAILEAGGLKGIGSMAKDYYIGGDLKTGLIRGGATYAGISLASRAITGGGLTTKANGERDIAGIPFI